MPCISTFGNNLFPGTIPSELNGLSYMENQLITKIHVFMTVVLSGDQYAQTDLSISFPVDVSESTSILPHNLNDCNIVILSYETSQNGTHQNFKVLTVRRDVVYKALHWLKKTTIFVIQILKLYMC